MMQPTTSDVSTQATWTPDSSYAVPLIIGVTGHRDLLATEQPLLAARIYEFFSELRQTQPDLPLLVLTGIACGADQLVADIAHTNGIEVVNVLPMPEAAYRAEFAGGALAEYERLLSSGQRIELPLTSGNTLDDILEQGPARDLQYEQLGRFLAAHCHILLALWDGRPSAAPGGTADVIRIHQQDTADGNDPLALTGRSLIDIWDDESDLVYHLACSRADAGPPMDSVTPGTTAWLTRDAATPRSTDLPERYRLVLRRLGQFNRDSRALSPEPGPRLVPPGVSTPSPALEPTARAFAQADRLAARFQRRFHRGLSVGLGCALLAGLCFILATDIPSAEPLLYGYFAAIGTGIAAFTLMRRRQWQRRYLDYRVLAESLRVQFYWALAGVARPQPRHFNQNTLIGASDLELGWIRHVLRHTGLQLNHCQTAVASEGLDLAIRHWVGRDDQGQLGYYRARAEDKRRRYQLTERISAGCFIAGMAIALLLALTGSGPAGSQRDWLIVLMGLLPLAAAVRQSYAQRLAQQDLVTQYAHMQQIFAVTGDLLSRTDDPARKRRLLLDAGLAALHENTLWHLRQRERNLPVTAVLSG